MRRTIASLLCCAAVIVFSAQPAQANHIFGTYSDDAPRGYHWLARHWDYGELWLTSNRCNARESGAFERVRASTADTTELKDRWPSGLLMVVVTCDSKVTESIDIDLEYSDFCKTHGCATYGGENHRTQAPKSYCEFWGAPSPCGVHPSTVHINLNKWNARSNKWRERLLMHETGHSNGLAHHCSSDSIMNNGTGGCNGGRWTEVMVYKPTDRNGIRRVYPDWIYP